jgi:hypothetical protein
LSFFEAHPVIGKFIGFMVKAALLFILLVLVLAYVVSRSGKEKAPEASPSVVASLPTAPPGPGPATSKPLTPDSFHEAPASTAAALPPVPAPASEVEESFSAFKPRQLAILEDPSAAGGGVWLATTVADRGELLYAEEVLAKNQGHAGAPIYQMSSHGRATYYANRSPVGILEVDGPWCLVTITAGEARGSKGWVQAKYLVAASKGNGKKKRK